MKQSLFRMDRARILTECLALLLLGFFLAGDAARGNDAAEGKPPRKIVMPPAVAGVFYPADKTELEKSVRKYLAECKKAEVPGRVRGLVCPHAGYQYSGIVAAAGYRLLDKSIRKVIVIASTHHRLFFGVSIPEADMYRTPLGEMRIARDAALLLKSEQAVSYVPDAFRDEHTLETQLPFVQVALGDVEIVPIICGMVDAGSLAMILERITDSSTLVVASADLSHYKSYEAAKHLDRPCAEAIASLDFSKMDSCDTCGRIPVLTLMRMAQALNWKGHLLDYRNSGDTVGRKDAVVGYASIAFTETKEAAPLEREISSRQARDLLAGFSGPVRQGEPR